MRLTKYTHSCVRLEHEGRVLVIDPGIWSEPGALRGADAVLLTHEHSDHVDTARLLGLGVPVFAPASPAGLDPIIVGVGETFTAAGFSVRTYGGRHATVYNGQPDCANLGYLVDDRVYHPGDSLTRPDRPVPTLLVPLHGSWLKTREAIDFVLAVGAKQTIGIHEGQLNDRGLSSVNDWLTETTQSYRYLPAGQSCDKLPG